MQKYTVYLGSCSTYRPDNVNSILKKALETIPLAQPVSGKIVIKPNLVMAHPCIATDGYTRKEVIEGILRLIADRGSNIQKIDIVEKSGLGVTTASMFKWAGYKELTKHYPVKLRPMEERPQVPVILKKGKIHQSVTIAKEMASRDFLIFAPKLKTNVLSHAYTGALKLNIGIIDSKERIYHHHYDLPAKIVDLLEVATPDLIVTDGIHLSFGGNQMTQKSTHFGVIAVSSNAVAHDMVCARLLGLDPFKIEHIKEAIDRGYGPSSFDQIDIIGDFPVDRGQKIVQDLDFGFYPVHRFPCFFEIKSGDPYCTGGCHGIFLDWLHMIEDRKPKLLKRFPKLTVLIGKVTEKIEDRTVLLVGNCAKKSSSIKANRIVSIKGCPPTHKRIVWDMMVNFMLLAPLIRPSLIIDGFILYPFKKFKGWLVNRLFQFT